jgi:hypothetical protein
VCAPVSVLPPHLRRGVPGGGVSPRRTGHMDRPGAGGAATAAMPGGQARMSGTPPRRRSKREGHSRLTACPAPRRPATRRGRWSDAPSARAALLASSAALPVPARLHDGQAVTPTLDSTQNPTLDPTHATRVPLAGRWADRRWSCPSGGVERPGRVVRFARLIQPPGRDPGGPAVRAASGGIQSLPSLPRSVVRRKPRPWAAQQSEPSEPAGNRSRGPWLSGAPCRPRRSGSPRTEAQRAGAATGPPRDRPRPFPSLTTSRCQRSAAASTAGTLRAYHGFWPAIPLRLGSLGGDERPREEAELGIPGKTVVRRCR